MDLGKLTPQVTVPNEYVEWLEEEKAVLWSESEAMTAFYRFLRDGGVPEELAQHLVVLRYQALLTPR